MCDFFALTLLTSLQLCAYYMHTMYSMVKSCAECNTLFMYVPFMESNATHIYTLSHAHTNTHIHAHTHTYTHTLSLSRNSPSIASPSVVIDTTIGDED